MESLLIIQTSNPHKSCFEISYCNALRSSTGNFSQEEGGKMKQSTSEAFVAHLIPNIRRCRRVVFMLKLYNLSLKNIGWNSHRYISSTIYHLGFRTQNQTLGFFHRSKLVPQLTFYSLQRIPIPSFGWHDQE